MDKEKLKTLYALAQDIMKGCPEDETACSDAENDIYDEIANLIQAVKNSNLI